MVHVGEYEAEETSVSALICNEGIAKSKIELSNHLFAAFQGSLGVLLRHCLQPAQHPLLHPT